MLCGGASGAAAVEAAVFELCGAPFALSSALCGFGGGAGDGGGEVVAVEVGSAVGCGVQFRDCGFGGGEESGYVGEGPVGVFAVGMGVDGVGVVGDVSDGAEGSADVVRHAGWCAGEGVWSSGAAGLVEGDFADGVEGA